VLSRPVLVLMHIVPVGVLTQLVCLTSGMG
jgi:hypothetical protein